VSAAPVSNDFFKSSGTFFNGTSATGKSFRHHRLSTTKEYQNMFQLLSERCANGYKVLFTLETTSGRTVAVAGSFNDWDPAAAPMLRQKDSNVYQTELVLPPGEYEYKFVVDGEWLLDEANPSFYPNDFGTLNSVLVVPGHGR
jgi:1,4-alpha-glucan branching enzyme